MTAPILTVEKRGHILLMGLNRVAKRNAFDLDLYHSLSMAYGELERRPAAVEYVRSYTCVTNGMTSDAVCTS